MFNSSCYRGFKTKLVLGFTEAQQLCMTEQTDSGLPSVHSLSELEYLIELGTRGGWFGPQKGIYLGGRLVDGELIWSDGSQTDFTIWKEGRGPKSHGCVAVFLMRTFELTDCNLYTEKQIQDAQARSKVRDFVICRINEVISGRKFGLIEY